jgi:hypothetical protein
MANTYTIKQTLEVTFSIPVSLQKDYKMLTEELTAKDSLIVNDIQDEVKDGTIDGSIIITVENGESIQDVIDDLELLEQGVSLQED